MTDRVESPWVLYSCPGSCGAADVRVAVPPRGPEQDIVSWVRDIAQTVSNHHALNHPGCDERLCDLKIPLKADETGTES